MIKINEMTNKQETNDKQNVVENSGRDKLILWELSSTIDIQNGENFLNRNSWIENCFQVAGRFFRIENPQSQPLWLLSKLLGIALHCITTNWSLAYTRTSSVSTSSSSIVHRSGLHATDSTLLKQFLWQDIHRHCFDLLCSSNCHERCLDLSNVRSLQVQNGSNMFKCCFCCFCSAVHPSSNETFPSPLVSIARKTCRSLGTSDIHCTWCK